MNEMITITRTEYQDIIDARDAAIAMRDIANGTLKTLSEDEVDAYLAAPSPLAFWRKRAGLTQTDLAARVNITQGFLAQVEGGRRSASIAVYAALAKALTVRIEDLIEG
jgi:DNA-binding XRE family transcriptional regulator